MNPACYRRDQAMNDARTTQERPRTATRLKGVAPPGLEDSRVAEGVKTIGRYEILSVIGKGAMGVVYKARDPALDRIVAVKTIVAPKGNARRRVREAYIERFTREAKAAAKMQHPAIVTIFDVGLDGNAPYMVLEYLPGETLADRLDRVRFPLGRAVDLARDLASALAFAHKERIVHRDVKPANVLHAGENRWKLADFGIVRLPDSDLTQAGIFMGTPGYAPPEAIRDGQYTPQADVFAWGAVLYELISGRIPYEGPDTPTTNGYVLRGTAKSPRVHDPSIPEPIADIVMTALAPDPGTRFKDAMTAEEALRNAWDDCLDRELVHPKALALRETPHDQVRGPFHGPQTTQGPAAVATHAERPGGRVFIDSDSGLADDDPTTLMVRESTPSPDADVPKPATSTVVIAEDDIIAQAKATVAKAGRGDDTDTLKAGEAAPRLWLWVTIILTAVIVGGIAAFYLWRL